MEEATKPESSFSLLPFREAKIETRSFEARPWPIDNSGADLAGSGVAIRTARRPVLLAG